MKNLVIGLNAGSPAQRNELTKLFSEKKWVYWHWIDDLWIVQVPNEYTPKTLHRKIEELPNIAEPTMLIFEFQGSITFWGRSKDDAWKWLNHIGNAG